MVGVAEGLGEEGGQGRLSEWSDGEKGREEKGSLDINDTSEIVVGHPHLQLSPSQSLPASEHKPPFCSGLGRDPGKARGEDKVVWGSIVIVQERK